jgi:hypothetical protein
VNTARMSKAAEIWVQLGISRGRLMQNIYAFRLRNSMLSPHFGGTQD